MARGRARPDGRRPDKHRAIVDSNTLEDQCHPRKIFVGGLAHKTTTQHLRDHFGRFGGIVDAVVLRWPDGRSRGFGYVTFADALAAASVLQEQHSLSGRDVDVKRAVPGTNKLFVGGLPQNTTANELREHFEKFGVVSDAVVMIDPATNRSRGFGFVCFLPGQEGAEAVATSLENYDNHRIRGKWIEVKSAAPPHKLAQDKSATPSQEACSENDREELSLAGALQNSNSANLSPSPLENLELHEREVEVQSLGSPLKVSLTSSGGSLHALPPGLADDARPWPGFGGPRPAEMPMQSPWWPSFPWTQPFAPGLSPNLPFDGPASVPLGIGGYYDSSTTPFSAGAQCQTWPHASQSEGLQRNLEQLLKQKMDGAVGKGSAFVHKGTPSVSTTCSATTQTEIVAAAALLP